MPALALDEVPPKVLSLVPAVANAVLAVLIGLATAELFWVLWPSHPPAVPAEVNPNVASAAEAAPVDVDAITAANLFGTVTGSSARGPDAIDAPETRLDLTLTGVVSDTAKQRSWALIRSQSPPEETAYAKGDLLSEDIEVYQIFRNRVVLSRGGRLETLTLQLEKAVRQNARQEVGNDEAGQAKAADVFKKLVANPRSITEYAVARPYRRNGRLYGVRVYPTDKGQPYFEQVGLEPGVLVKSINGLPLNGTMQWQHVGQELRQATHLSLIVGRGDVSREVTVPLE